MILNIAIIIVSIALIASVLLQSKGIGLGGLAGGDTGGVYTQRRGIEKVMFYITIALSVVFLLLALINVIIS
ncbi:MAG: preprotein translocase subunit SecG [Anaerolineaceae bacterium]|jgi:preprotein translocase subunit SecG|nr:preprotein translocase subunit SecG [Anaerolineaceae bacterium]MDI9530920.1 preprotein translocase subunit SecG [Chloroflexota bacterium]NLE93920.1 preprotein translocase subunit SecG [Chloroflexota bacterium]HNZ15860.1 preprotein translocase subunit SecG [Anaerolineaceae bacterium]HOF28218.1 preprotein translocase subunit SecG [Anaerolineaceae bacterium]